MMLNIFPIAASGAAALPARGPAGSATVRDAGLLQPMAATPGGRA